MYGARPVSTDVATEGKKPEPRRGFFALDPLDNRFPMLHGLRVLGILSVVQYHVTLVFAGEQHLPIDGDYAATSLAVFFGMDLFFVLSGFLIGTILLRSLELSGTQNLKRFYIRRIFRTFPSYYVVLAVLALTTHISAEQRAHLPYEAVYLTNFLPLGRDNLVMFWGWSLALEEQFYLTVPLLFYVLWRLRTDAQRVTLLGILWASALVVRFAVYLRGAPWTDIALSKAVYFRTYTRFDTLVCGIALAFVFFRYGDRIAKAIEDPLARALLSLPAMLGVWLLMKPDRFGTDAVQIFHLFAWGTITSIMYFTGLLVFLTGKGAFARAMSHPIFRVVATLGYGIYLIHIPILDYVVVPMAKALDKRGVPMWANWPLSFVVLMILSIALAYVLHVLVEKPTLRIREKLAR